MITAALVFAATVVASCPTQPPRLSNTFDYRGEKSGCAVDNNIKCLTGETIILTALPFPTYTFQSCDQFKWRPHALSRAGGDPDWIRTGTKQTLAISFPFISFQTIPAVNRYELIAYNDLGEDGIQYRHDIPLTNPPCPQSSIPSAITLNYRGSKSGCTRANADCLAGEEITFTVALAEYATEIPNCDVLTFAFEYEGTVNVPVDAPVVKKFFDVGKFWAYARFQDQHGNPRPLGRTQSNAGQLIDTIQMTISATAKPAVQPPKRRAVRH